MHKGGTPRCPLGKHRHRSEWAATQRQLRSNKFTHHVPTFCSACAGWHLSAPAGESFDSDEITSGRTEIRSAPTRRAAQKRVVRWSATHRPKLGLSQHEPVRTCTLIVHPDGHSRAAMMTSLSTRGFTVFGAADFNEALNVWMCHRCELLVTAIDMPGGTGIELLQRLASRGVRGIAVAVEVDQPTELSIFAASFQCRLSDPFDSEALAAAVDYKAATHRVCPESRR